MPAKRHPSRSRSRSSGRAPLTPRAEHDARTEHWSIDWTTLDRIALLTAGLKKRMMALLQIGAGGRVVDVGCGPGVDTVETARVVGDTGLVVGIDHDELSLAKAQERAREAGVGAWTHHESADAASIPFEADFFDAARSERLFQHVPHPAAVLREMVRVTKPGGRIAVADSDWATLSVDTTDVEIERQIVRALPGFVQNAYTGRELLRLFRAHPLIDVVVEIHPVVWLDYPTFWATSFSLPDFEAQLLNSGVVSSEELNRFRVGLAEAQATGAFFAHGNIVVVAAVKKG